MIQTLTSEYLHPNIHTKIKITDYKLFGLKKLLIKHFYIKNVFITNKLS